MVNATTEREVTLQVAVNPNLDKCTYTTNIRNVPEGELRMCQVSVTVTSKIALEQMQICLHVDPPLKCSQQIFTFREISNDTTQRLVSWIYQTDGINVPNLDVVVTISYINKQSIVRIQQKKVTLPLELVVKLGHPTKDAAHKFTLSVTKSAVELAKLFTELCGEGSYQALGFVQICTGSKVTIVMAKNSSRYR